MYLKTAIAGVNSIFEGKIFVTEPYFDTLTGGSRAIARREPCQAGNRAALSGIRGVPWGRLPRVKHTEFTQERSSIFWCMVLFQIEGLNGGFYASGIISQMASARV